MNSDFPHLHPDTIEEVKQRVDIVEIISDHVVLKKRGQNYVGLCPFHDEKTPSFTVSPNKQMYYCFGCGQGGNSLKFLMEIGKQSFTEVVFELARTYQVPIKTLEPEKKQILQRQISLKEQLYEILAVASSFYHHALYQSQGETALNYLKNQRQLTDEVIQHFQLGYAPGGWETLYRYLVEQKRYPLSLVEECGLIKSRKTGNGYYDQFRDRLMIPILDPQGRVIGFGSRTLGTDEPKYLNSPDTPLFSKGKTLFALDKAKSSIAKQDQAIVVEGYFDVIALHSQGFTNVVASLGTAFTKDQLRLLLRYTESKQVIFNFDADTAGIKATQRAIAEIEPLVYSGQLQLRILNITGGKDADEFLNNSEENVIQYQKLIENAPLWFDWQIQQLLKGKDIKKANQFEQVCQEMINLLNRLEDGNKRMYYLEKCAGILSLGNSQLIPLYLNQLKIQLKKPIRKAFSPQNKKTNNNNNQVSPIVIQEREELKTHESLLMQIYLHFPEYREGIMTKLTEQELFFCLDPYRLLWQKILQLQEDDPDIINQPNNLLLSKLQDLLLNTSQSTKNLSSLFYLFDEKTEVDVSNASLQIESIILRLKIIALEKYAKYCTQQWLKASDHQREDLSQYYSQERLIIQEKIKKLKSQTRMI